MEQIEYTFRSHRLDKRVETLSVIQDLNSKVTAVLVKKKVLF